MADPLHLIPDAPIDNPNFDRLDRMAFVRSFAEAIRAVKGADSVVLALAGPWGSGKSSLINLVSGELARTPGEKPPLVVKFNPWWFSGTGKLVAAFLEQLSAAVSRPEVVEILGDASIALKRLAEAIGSPGDFKPGEDVTEKDIEIVRQRVTDVFHKSDRRILIFMDDIDRLSPDEMTQLLLIVRAVAVFPNTTYVLAFDYEVVVEAIGSKLGVDGRTYLEKVIQLQIDVPLPGRMTLERMVVGQLEAIDPQANNLDSEAQRDFQIVFERGVKHFLATPRACTRLLNVMRFTYPTLTDQVYFPDMLGVCCLMSFSSQAIHAIRSVSEAFVGHCDPSGRGWTDTRQFHQQWLAELAPRDRPSVEAIVRLLFPKVSWALNGPLCGEEYIDIWQRRKRICSEKHFESYFRLGLSAGEAAEHQWQNMVELLGDASAFARALNRFGPLEEGQDTEWVSELLQKTADFVKSRATPEQASNLFLAIMRQGDQIASVRAFGSQQRLNIEPIHWVVSVLLDCLLRLDDPEDRFNLICEAVKGDGGLLTSAELVDLLNYRTDIFAGENEAPSTETNSQILMEVLKLLDARIQAACDDGELLQHTQYMKIVQKWRQFGRRVSSRNWIQEICEDDDEFLNALAQVYKPGTSNNGNAVNCFPVDSLIRLFDRQMLADRADQMLADDSSYDDDQQQLLASLSAAMNDPEVIRRDELRLKRKQP